MQNNEGIRAIHLALSTDISLHSLIFHHQAAPLPRKQLRGLEVSGNSPMESGAELHPKHFI